MKKLHALGTGLVGVTLSASVVLAAAPSPSDTTSTIPTSASEDTGKPADNHGAAVSAVATDSTQVGGEHDNHGGAVSAVAHPADETSDEAPAPDVAPEDQTHPDNHGAAVSAVATDKTKVGGKHDNHGGAVSEAAHQAPKSNGHAPGHPGGND